MRTGSASAPFQQVERGAVRAGPAVRAGGGSSTKPSFHPGWLFLFFHPAILLFLAGSFVMQKGDMPRIVGFSGKTPTDPAPKKVDIIYRSSPSAAGKTAGITNIWKGELVYTDVPVIETKRTPPRATTQVGSGS